MKTSKYLLTALFALVLTGTVRAGDSDYSMQSQDTASSRSDDSPFVWRVVRYPFRVAATAVRSPLIAGETLIGRRSIIGEHGFFARKQVDESLTMRRVAFAGDIPDND
jgi:hypothetical protein